jgi:plasmid stability protein
VKTLTIRNVPDDLDKALQRERARRGKSLNQTVLELLRQRLAVGVKPSNGLGRLAGGWSARDQAAFERATAVFEEVDEEV